MAEVMGLVASLLTLGEGAHKALKMAVQVHKAPDDIAALQCEVEVFNKVVKEVSRFRGDQDFLKDIIDVELSQSKCTIESLQVFINNSLLRKGMPSRRSWIRQKGRMAKIRDELKLRRKELMLSLIASNSTSSTRAAVNSEVLVQYSQTSAATIQGMLQELSTQSASTQALVQQSAKAVMETQEMVSSRFLNQGPHWEDPQCSANCWALSSAHHNQLGSCSPGTSPASVTVRGPLDSQCSSSSSDGATPGMSQSPTNLNPTSQFELSSSFFPEQYTLKTTISRICVYTKFEKFWSSEQRIDEYHLFFSQSPRQWVDIRVTISTSRHSNYWAPFRLPTSPVLEKGIQTLFKPLQRKLEQCLPLLDTHFNSSTVTLNLFDENPSAELSTQSPISAWQKIADSKAAQLLDFVRDLGCPTYYEREIFQQSRVGSRGFHSCLPNGVLCDEKRVCFSYMNLEDTKWRLGLFQSLKDSPYIPKLIGVVVDDKMTSVKAILETIANKSVFTLLFEARKANKLISLSRRLQLARHIIQAVRDVHNKGWVVGKLHTALISLDLQGNITIRSLLRSQKIRSIPYPACIAPEHRELSQDSECHYTSRSDLFQLGHLLWHLAVHESERHGLFCNRLGCTDLKSCKADHASPIQLPALKNAVPEWYSRIVEICRSERPQDRLPASTLLSMFPPVTNGSALEAEEVEISRMPGRRYHKKQEITCSCCLRACFKYYVCFLCRSGNTFDVCDSCVAAGLHCNDDQHFLEETIRVGLTMDIFEITGRYHFKRTVDGECRDDIRYFT